MSFADTLSSSAVSQCVDHRPFARSHDQSSLPLDAQPVLAVAECDTHELASVVSRREIWRMLAWSWCVMCTVMEWAVNAKHNALPTRRALDW